MAEFTTYLTVDDFLARNTESGTLVEVAGLVKNKVRGDSPYSGLYLVGRGDFVRLHSDISEVIQYLTSFVNGRPVKVTGVPITVENKYYDIFVKGVKICHYDATQDGGISAESQSTLREIERRAIERVLILTKWNKKEAARLLEVSRGTIYRKITENGITKPHQDLL